MRRTVKTIKTKARRGAKFGDWTLKKLLGAGGNGSVWLAENSESERYAIKILEKLSAIAYQRFSDEVSIVKRNVDIRGLMPIIDEFLPERIQRETPWYVMPIAQPVIRWLRGKTFEQAIDAVLEVGEILVQLHNRAIYHRDIKPANILVVKGRCFLSDFGLVKYPEKRELTRVGEQVGPRWTIAPEMKRNGHKASGGPADVYSLAKATWILLTGQELCFEGQYDADSSIGLKHFGLTEPERGNLRFPDGAPPIYTGPLDDLLRQSTDEDPARRPTIDQFVERLGSWTEIYKDFQRRNPLEWRDVQGWLFPAATPQRAIWEDLATIARILNQLGSVRNLNHMIFPGGGGMDVEGAKPGSECGTIELDVGGSAVQVLRARRLLFESFGADLEWNYFMLEAETLEPIGSEPIYRGAQELVELAPGRYVNGSEWEVRRSEASGAEFPRLVERYTKGKFVIFQKTSIYNRITYTYDGRHNQMTTDGFRTYIARKVELSHRLAGDPRVKEAAQKSGWSVEDLVFGYLNHVFREEYLRQFSRQT